MQTQKATALFDVFVREWKLSGGIWMKTIRRTIALMLAFIMWASVANNVSASIVENLRMGVYGVSDFFDVPSDYSYDTMDMRKKAKAGSTEPEDNRDDGKIYGKVDGKAEDDELAPEMMKDGRIVIANLKQLCAIGTDENVTDGDLSEDTFGKGSPVYTEEGVPAKYSLGASYYIMSEIPLKDCEFSIPEGFCGSFSGDNASKRRGVYDEKTDTVYIGTIYQLAILASEERSEMPVMTGDLSSDTFGMGRLIFPEDGDEFLTYSKDHNYVLLSTFTTEKGASPALASPQRSGDYSSYVDGRDYFGQVSVDIAGETYILIGDRQQLDAINSDDTVRTKVSRPVFKVTEGAVEVWRTSLHVTGDWIWLSDFDGSKDLKDGNGYGTTAEEVMASYQTLTSGAQIIYPGDADLVDLGSDGDFSSRPLYDVNSSGYHKLDRPGGTATSGNSKRDIYFTTNASGIPDLSTATTIASDPTVGTLKYEKDGKYIVFRDINMAAGYNVTVTEGKGGWKPLMFTGEMYGVKVNGDGGKLWDDGKTQMNLDTSVKPEIYNINVNAVAMASTLFSDNSSKLDLDVHTGVGFFGTLTGSGTGDKTEDPDDPDKEIYDLVGNLCVVRNIRLRDGSVTNQLTAAKQKETVINFLTGTLGAVLDAIVSPLLRVLTGKDDIGLSALTDVLNTRVSNSTNLATGAFAGRIMGNVLVADCEVKDIEVSSVLTDAENPDSASLGTNKPKIVGTGGFVGHAEGATSYEGLSKLLGTLVDSLSDLLNLIPGLGLGDLVTLLLNNLLPVGQLIPTGYTTPEITNCAVDHCTLDDVDGKYGVGGFAGSLAGVIVTDCKVKNCEMTVNADHFGGGFAGASRDGVIKATLSGLGIDVASLIHPQTELIRCSIENSDMEVKGGTFLGGFSGVLANSYGINDTVDEDSELTVTGSGDYIGGFTGYATLGSIFGFADYINDGSSLLTVVKQVATALLGNSEGDSLLDLGGVAAAAILGWENHTPLTVTSTGGNFVGGIVGKGEGTIIAKSDVTHIRKLSKYKRQRINGTYYVTTLPITSAEGRNNQVTSLVSVSAGKDYAGGIAGHIGTASVGGLLGSTLGLGQFIGFEVSDTYITGIDDETGYTVQTGTNIDEDDPERGDYAGGAFGWAAGGEVRDVYLDRLGSVSGNNHIGGFGGTTGPGDLVSNDGLNLQLLGISLISANNLLSLISAERTTYLRANVKGITAGYTVTETGLIEDNATDEEYTAGGFFGDANSVRVVDCHADKLLSVTANSHDGIAGGFVGRSAAGDTADAVEHVDTDDVTQLLALNDLVNAIPLLVPSYDGCDVTYVVDGGYVEGDAAGGFTGDFRSGKINTYTMETTVISGNTYTGVNPIDDPNTTYEYTCGNMTKPWSVNNIRYVRGGNYGGGWGGHVYPGALASAGGGLSILGVADTSALSATDLLGVADVYIPIIKYAGINSPNGFTVYAAHDESEGANPATAGYAGGFIGYGQSVQVSYSDVKMLAHRICSEPESFTDDDKTAYGRIDIYPSERESQDGSEYINYASSASDEIPYSVAGAIYAGGYIGSMDVGSAASVGDNLSLLGNSINLTDVLGVLNVVVSTIEHSDVYGAPGGFDVIASTHVNLGDSHYDANGVSHAGGYAGRISGGHIQDGNSYNFSYIIGEVTAGGYVGEMVPGNVANVMPQSDLSILGNVSGLASLAEDFVPTIRNSETTCIPCGGAIRAQCFSDRTTLRGMAGGYVGHIVGGQIWGNSNDTWKSENDGINLVTGNQTNDPEIGHYTGEQRLCYAVRIRSVYGAEYAGGFCGFMEAGSTADVGSLSLLGGLLNADNLFDTLGATYSTIKRAKVSGPLRDIDENTWLAWKEFVGSQGQFAYELLDADYDDLERFIYGTHVVAGRHKFNNSPNTFLSGCAGGFIGSMHSGVVEHSECLDTKLVLGMRAAGGFAGEMQTGNIASAGGISLLGLDLNLGSLAPKLGSVFVPAIKDSKVTAYSNGLQVGATGSIGNDIETPIPSPEPAPSDEPAPVPTPNPDDEAFGSPSESDVGCAGGFVGGAYGGQLERTEVRKLKRVKGVNAIGGYVGRAAAAALASADTENASSGILQKLLNDVISSKGGLVDALHATVCTINDVVITSVDEDYGFVVDGEYKVNSGKAYAPYAGGFAGELKATLVNTKKGGVESEVFTPDTDEGTTTVSISKLRGVNGGHYSGGFVGLASVGSVAQIGGSQTNILSLLNVGNIGLLDVFRTYIYRSTVEGVAEGVRVYAHDWQQPGGSLQSTKVTGAAGGFVGGLMSGTIEDCSITNLNYVEAPNYAAGFCGHSGVKGVLDVSGLEVADNDSILARLLAVLGLDLSAALQLLNIIGSTFERDTVTGYGGSNDGFIVRTHVVQTESLLGVQKKFISGSCAAGFAGYAEIAQIEDNCQALKIKKVDSPQIAGGFVGRTSVAYLAELNASSDLVGALTWLVRLLLGVLGIGALENSGLINLYTDILGLQVGSDGYLVRLNLFGLVVGISAVSRDPETNEPTAVTLVLGSSIITLPVGTDGEVDTTNLTIELIELNRTAIRDALARGVIKGYDVFGGGADDAEYGTDEFGYAGGFIGLNDHGFVSNSIAELCDTVHGTPGKTGPFVGYTLFNPNSQPVERLEGNNNYYYIYRDAYRESGTAAFTEDGDKIADAEPTSVGGRSFNRYAVEHLGVISGLSDFAGAYEQGLGEPRDLKAYCSNAKFVGMGDTPQPENPAGSTPMPGEKKDPCEGGDPFDIKVNKVWDDDNDALGKRTDEITITVCAVQVQSLSGPAVKCGKPPAGAARVWSKNYTLDANDGSELSDVWEMVISDLPFGCVHEGVYYEFYVYEAVPNFYRANYVLDNDSATVTIVNTIALLPDTGGSGTEWIMLAGALLITLSAALAVCMINRRERRVNFTNRE